jgi:hypothetical protein
VSRIRLGRDLPALFVVATTVDEDRTVLLIFEGVRRPFELSESVVPLDTVRGCPDHPVGPPRMPSTASTRLVRWFTYNLGFALLPLASGLLLRELADRSNQDASLLSSEVLFFSLMVSATALGDLADVSPHISGGWTLTLCRSALLLGAILSAILYGSFLYDTLLSTGLPEFRSRVFTFSRWLASVLFVLSTLVEVLLARIRVL